MDDDYGTLKAYYESWGPDIDGVKFEEIPTRNCTPEDWGIGEDGDKTKQRFADPKSKEDIGKLK